MLRTYINNQSYMMNLLHIRPSCMPGKVIRNPVASKYARWIAEIRRTCSTALPHSVPDFPSIPCSLKGAGMLPCPSALSLLVCMQSNTPRNGKGRGCEGATLLLASIPTFNRGLRMYLFIGECRWPSQSRTGLSALSPQSPLARDQLTGQQPALAHSNGLSTLRSTTPLFP